MSKLHFYELDFNGYGEEEKETDNSYSYCIKTEIENITMDQAYDILGAKETREELTRVIEIPEEEALDFYDADELKYRKEKEFGVYYSRVE